jgi:hypothetical protein
LISRLSAAQAAYSEEIIGYTCTYKYVAYVDVWQAKVLALLLIYAATVLYLIQCTYVFWVVRFHLNCCFCVIQCCDFVADTVIGNCAVIVPFGTPVSHIGQHIERFLIMSGKHILSHWIKFKRLTSLLLTVTILAVAKGVISSTICTLAAITSAIAVLGGIPVPASYLFVGRVNFAHST